MLTAKASLPRGELYICFGWWWGKFLVKIYDLSPKLFICSQVWLPRHERLIENTKTWPKISGPDLIWKQGVRPIRAPVLLNQQKWLEANKKPRPGFGPCCSREWGHTRLPCSLPEEGRAASSCPGLGLEGVPRPPPSGGAESRGQAQCPAHTPDSSGAAVGLFWPFCTFCP